MLHKLSVWYSNLNFRRKISLVCLVSGLLPVLVLGAFCYGQIHTLLINREKQALTETAGQAAATMQERFETCHNVISHIAWNESIGQAVSQKYSNNYEMYIAYRDMIDPLFATVCMLNHDIISGTLYTYSNLYRHGNTVKPIDEVKQFPWYSKAKRAKQPNFYISAEKKMMTLYSPVFSGHTNSENFVCIHVDYKKIFSQMDSLFDEDFGLILLDENGDIIYSYQDFEDNQLKLPIDNVLAQIKDGSLSKTFLSARYEIPAEGWSLYLYRPLHTISVNTRQITFTVLLVAVCCTLLLYLLTYFLSKAVVRPLENLTNNMQQIEQGDLSLNLPKILPRNDEIGVLVKQFRAMVKKLQYLVNEVYKNKIVRQEYEMKALQAQIKPHFFYNSLSLINSKAILAGQDDISDMAQLLSTFYRTTLNRGHSHISVSDEWTNTISYVKIQLIMHSYSFEVFEELNPIIKDYKMPNLLLQPLVENAIVHGIDHKVTPGKGQIRISGTQEENQLIFTVEDNGCGISQEDLEHLLEKESNGYGVQNVQRRVQLYYGENYGLTYNSEINRGTKVTLKIPTNNISQKTDL